MTTRLLAAAALAGSLLAATVGGAEARDGCGLGFHRGVYGWCRPNLGYRPFVYRRPLYGYRRFGWHGGFRHVGFGFHRGGHHRW